MKMNQSGQLTVDFLFAIVIAFGLFIMFFAMTFTFSVVEVTQYISYSTSRAHAASNLDKQAQKDAGLKKFEELTKKSLLSSLYSNGWFVVGNPVFKQSQPDDSFANDFSGTTVAQYMKVFTGATIPFQSKLLNVQIPFIKSKEEDDPGLFSTNVTTILIRESSQKECQDYWGDQRAQALSHLPSGDSKFYSPSKYVMMEDNGC